MRPLPLFLCWKSRIVALFAAQALVMLSSSAYSRPLNPGESGWYEKRIEVCESNLGMKALQEKALSRVRHELIESCIPARLSFFEHASKGELSGRLFDSFLQSVLTDVSGVITEEEQPRYESFTKEDVLCVACSLKARVKREDKEPDPGFTIAVELNSESLVYRDRDELTISLKSTRSCFISVFNLGSDGRFRLCYPNSASLPAKLSAGRLLTLPVGQETIFRVGLPEAVTEARESILVVGTLDTLQFITTRTTSSEGSQISLPEGSYAELGRWIMTVPADRRALAGVSYFIVR